MTNQPNVSNIDSMLEKVQAITGFDVDLYKTWIKVLNRESNDIVAWYKSRKKDQPRERDLLRFTQILYIFISEQIVFVTYFLRWENIVTTMFYNYVTFFAIIIWIVSNSAIWYRIVCVMQTTCNLVCFSLVLHSISYMCILCYNVDICIVNVSNLNM